MQKIRLILASVILIFFIDARLMALADEIEPKTLNIKGFYLGMAIEDGAKILKKFITPQFSRNMSSGSPLETTRIPPFETCHYGFGYFPPGCPKIFLKSDCSKDKKVNYIYLPDAIVENMFDAQGLSQEEFVRVFEKIYHIKMILKKKLNPDGSSSSESWQFENPNGWKVTIESVHTIIIKRT